MGQHEAGGTRRSVRLLVVVAVVAVVLPVAALTTVVTGTVTAAAAATPTAGPWGGDPWVPRTTRLTSISCATTSDCVTVGVGTTALTTADGGTTWTTRTLAVPLVLTGIGCTAATTCTAVGTAWPGGGAPITARTADGGANWTTAPAAVGSSITCPTATLCLSPVDSTSISRSTDGGATWTPVPTSGAVPAQTVGPITCADASTCLAPGAGGTLLRTTDGGQSWSPGNSPMTAWLGLACAGSDCLAVATGVDSMTLSSADAGLTWTTRGPAPSGPAIPSTCLSPTRCLFGPSLTTNGGGSWSYDGTTDAYAGRRSCPSAVVCVEVDNAGGIRTTSDGGSTWSSRRSDDPMAIAADVRCPVVGRCIAHRTQTTAMHSIDGGVTWLADSSTNPSPLWDASCAPGTTHCVFSTGTSSPVWISDDVGASWVQGSTPAAGSTQACGSPTSCVALFGYSTDGGWSERTAVSFGMPPLHCWDGTHCIGPSAVTVDGGRTWTHRPSATGISQVTALACGPTRCVMFGTAGGNVVEARSADQGATWSGGPTSPDLEASSGIKALACPDDVRCLAVGTTRAGLLTILRTSDGGLTWQQDAMLPRPGGGNASVSCPTVSSCVVLADGVLTNGPPTPDPSTLPTAPTGVTATGSANHADLTWTAPAVAGASPITGYQVTASPGGITFSTGNQTSASFPGLPAGTYTFTVRAVTTAGVGPPSSTSPPAPVGVLPPDPPTTAATVASGKADVYLAAPRSTSGLPVTSYTVTLQPGGFAASVPVTGVGWAHASFSGLTDGTTYTVTAAATSSAGTGGPAPPFSVIPHGPRPPITGVTGTAGDGSARITWQPLPPGTVPYDYCEVGGPAVATTIVPGTATSAALAGLANGTAVSIAVSCRGIDNNDWSNPPPVTLTPQAGRTFGGGYHPVTPTRVLDSRTTLGGFGGPVGDRQTKDLVVADGSTVPTTAQAAVLSLTVTGGTLPSYLTAFPAGANRPTTATQVFAAGQTVTITAVVPLGAGGAVSIFNQQGSVDVVADLVGWFDTGADRGNVFAALAPIRALDSRTATGGWSGPLGPGATADLNVAGVGGVPATATAVVANVTVTGPTAASYLTAYPAGTARPTAATTVFAPGQTVTTLAVLPLGAAGTAGAGAVSFFNQQGSTDVIVDVVGWFEPDGDTTKGRYHPIVPARVLDDRGGTGVTGPWTAGATRTVPVTGAAVPAEATAITGTLTATNPTEATYITAAPSAPVPTAANLLVAPDQTIDNTLVTGLGAGQLAAYNQLGSVDLVLDVSGWFAAG